LLFAGKEPNLPASSDQQPLNVVIPIVAGVGNALMALPMVRQLKRARPAAQVTVIARLNAMAEPFRRLLDINELDEVLVNGGGAAGHLRGLAWTRARKPDLYLVPFPSNRWQYALLAAASGSRRRLLHGYPVGYWRALHFLPSERLPAQRGLHDVVQNLRMLRALDIEPDESESPRFLLNETDRLHATTLLRNLDLDDDAPFIAIHAGSGKTILAQAKRWPPANYARMIQQLDRPVVLLEGPDEAGVADEILRFTTGTRPRVLRLRGPLGDAAAVLERASIYIGSDSGLAHLAAAVGTPPVTIFAPADPERVCPFGYRHLVVQPIKSCVPCFEYPWKTPYPKMSCRQPMCVTEITVQQVMEKVQEFKVIS
jgi:ADP-heptose:LPS heptosyltransferase